MTLTLLLDLDDTLLNNPFDTFTPLYLQALGNHLSDSIPPDRMVRTLLNATQAMILNQRPDITLEHVFDSEFYPSLGLEKANLSELINSFYSQVFPGLQSVTAPRPAAVDLVRQAFKRGYRVVIATNPLFPRTAIHQRLAWAGLAPVDTPFDLVTSFETFHFAKPNPAYYAEILAQLGWPDGPAVMVGNDPENDIAPAAQAGLYTYLLSSDDPQSAHPAYPNGAGPLKSLLPWLEKLVSPMIQAESIRPTALISILKTTPAALLHFTRQLGPENWGYRSHPGDWTLIEIICHLRDVAKEVDLPRVEMVLNDQNPFIPGIVTDPWAKERDYAHQDGAQALHTFIDNRIRLLDILEHLNSEEWDRPARHAIFGPTRLRELVGFITTHDRAHIQQSYRTFQGIFHRVPSSDKMTN
ncbi:MAG: DinB family protein [Anaerolineaceae bacterium]|nr:DinB family protein [Anaerolineaceae bacterium]